MTYTITGSHPFSWGHPCLSCRIFQYNELLRPLWLQIMILWITIYMSFVGNIVLPKVLNFCSNCKLPLTQPHPSDWKSWLLFSKKNKTENPSKDALDKTENYAKCKLCQLWPDPPVGPPPPGWPFPPDWPDKYSPWIEYEKGSARTVKHANCQYQVAMRHWDSEWACEWRS